LAVKKPNCGSDIWMKKKGLGAAGAGEIGCDNLQAARSAIAAHAVS
jgi:hypothetical protein